MTAVSLRNEKADDAAAVRSLIDAAFADMPFSDGTEGAVMDGLRVDGDCTLAMVAEDASQIVGQIAFSPIRIDGAADWYQLGPVAVTPALQRSGIGSALVEEGIAAMREKGARGIALVGNPAYYSRFGFTRDHALTLSDAMDPVLQIVVLKGEPPVGQITLAPAFG